MNRQCNISAMETIISGESEGKDFKGIYPSSANYTTDLHSQDNTFVNVSYLKQLKVNHPKHDLTIEEDR